MESRKVFFRGSYQFMVNWCFGSLIVVQKTLGFQDFLQGRDWGVTTNFSNPKPPKRPKPPAMRTIRVFPNIGVPQNGWFIVENPIKMDDLGVPLFLETPISW